MHIFPEITQIWGNISLNRASPCLFATKHLLGLSLWVYANVHSELETHKKVCFAFVGNFERTGGLKLCFKRVATYTQQLGKSTKQTRHHFACYLLGQCTCVFLIYKFSKLTVRARCIEEESSTCGRLGVNRPSDTQDAVGLLLLIVECLLKQNGDWSRVHKPSH